MKTVLITGASSGIGKEIAYVYAENKYNLVLVARRKEKLEAIKNDIEQKYEVTVEIIDTDLSKLDSAEKLYEQIAAKNIEINILINNAGFGINGKFIDADIKSETDMLLLNIVTLTKLTKLFAKDMIKSGGGDIINIASTAAFQAVPNFAAYAASKSYVLHFSEAIAFELKDKNINVTAICPGATQSEFAKVSNTDEKHFKNGPSSRELAEFTYTTMKSKIPVAVHGFINRLMVFSLRFSPRKAIVAIAAKMMK